MGGEGRGDESTASNTATPFRNPSNKETVSRFRGIAGGRWLRSCRDSSCRRHRAGEKDSSGGDECQSVLCAVRESAIPFDLAEDFPDALRFTSAQQERICVEESQAVHPSPSDPNRLKGLNNPLTLYRRKEIDIPWPFRSAWWSRPWPRLGRKVASTCRLRFAKPW